MSTTYVSVPLLSLASEEILPGNLYICIHHKMIRYRNKGDHLDAEHFNKLVYSQVKLVFIDEAERAEWERWLSVVRQNQDRLNSLEPASPGSTPAASTPAQSPNVQAVSLALGEGEDLIQPPPSERTPINPKEAKPILEAIGEQRRALMDIFANPRDDKQVLQAIEASRRVVTEFLRKPFAVNNMLLIQKYSKGVFDHSMNVSVLSVFLGLRMGYSHQIILGNLAMGGLFHDLGKTLVEKSTDGLVAEDDPELRKHPILGAELLEKHREIPNEVRMIVAQHHEFLDGTGYPNRLKGLAIYDPARLVAIANLYDNLISESFAPTLKEKAIEALENLENNFHGKLDPKKLEKAIKILRYSFL